MPDWLKNEQQQVNQSSFNESADDRIKRANALLADVGILPLGN